MATYFIGDIQGCFDELMLLLKKINFDHHCDTLYLTGDLIGRGPKALETLEFITAHQSSINTVLGNHDIHFLAISCGIKKAKKSDYFEQLLASPSLDYYVDYLRHQPLLIELSPHNIILTHAGLSPQWSISAAKTAANLVESQLKQDNFSQLLSQMYTTEPSDVTQCNTAIEHSIYAINALTRMRYCYHGGQLEFSQKCPPHQLINQDLTPWFSLEHPVLATHRVVFGHWASLQGVTNHPNAIALDTGCLWGQFLSAWCLETNEITQQKSLMFTS
ncbi:MAG: symmetrical bis(5'-nucleosyl)-tetraphosphatase [Gammaproteobacteria bacterium]|nr:symmetrical bis(5'-nucleosyl)-tetraphosphatase [Gammaproteobacteria bacterium]